MPRIAGTSNAQTIFLRAFRTHPAGPPPELWPSPAILRRWLRSPAFRRALQSVQDALRVQADFQLANAATQAAQRLAANDTDYNTLDLNRLLRLSYLRQRFNPQAPANGAPQLDADQIKNGHADDGEQDGDDDLSEYPKFDENGRWVTPYDAACRRLAPRRLDLGFLPPITLHPDFPPPVPQDTYYYNLLHNPKTLLWYMKLHDQHFPDAKRFSKILDRCTEITPHEGPAGPFPHFPKQPANADPPTPQTSVQA